MASIQVVTGYVPIPNHPRSAATYGELGEQMFGPLARAGYPALAFYETIPDTWLYKLVSQVPHHTTHSAGDNPAKNTLAYHCVQHQKFGWLVKAMIQHKVDTYVWLDYGIGHVPGVTPEVVIEFLKKVRKDDFAIPGCWDTLDGKQFINDLWPCWRFCGGLMIVPRNRVYRLYKAIKKGVQCHLAETRNIPWEVNALAAAEPELLIRWYQADHNETMFTHYDKDFPNAVHPPDHVVPA